MFCFLLYLYDNEAIYFFSLSNGGECRIKPGLKKCRCLFVQNIVQNILKIWFFHLKPFNDNL